MRNPKDEIQALKEASLLRKIGVKADSLLNFSSNDYLGLSKHPLIVEAYREGVSQYGCGATASRLICGSMAPHFELESLIAESKGTEAALVFSTGYATSVGVLTAVLGKGDTVILDKLCHASLIDGARMSGATIRVYPHNNLKRLEALLISTMKKTEPSSRVLVVTESVFSMDGDRAPLRKIVELSRRYQSLLMVDEAHALGVMGPTGMGLAEELGVQEGIDFQMGTLGKAAGVAGGYVAAKQVWIDLLINRARSFIYSTAPPPAQAMASIAAIRLIQSKEGEQLRMKLWENINEFFNACQIKQTATSSIIPWMVGESEDALDLSKSLLNEGVLAPAIRFPTVPKHTARLRITISASHQSSDILRLAESLIVKH